MLTDLKVLAVLVLTLAFSFRLRQPQLSTVPRWTMIRPQSAETLSIACYETLA